jgi:hypothetical protein
MKRLPILLLAASVMTASCGGDSAVSSAATVQLGENAGVWARLPDDAFSGDPAVGGMVSVAVGGPGFVAVGSDYSGDRWYAAVWTSPDGLSWTRVPHDEAVFGGSVNATMLSVTTGGPGLVAVGYVGLLEGDEISAVHLPADRDQDAAVWTSSDGYTWTRVPDDEAVFGGDSYQLMYAVTEAASGLVAVGYDGPPHARNAAVWTSPDGYTWTRVPDDQSALEGGVMRSVIAADPGLVAVGQSDWLDGDPSSATGATIRHDAAVWTSPDGLTWTRIPDDEAVFAGSGEQRMRSVAVGGSGLVAAGAEYSDGEWHAAVWTSPDAYTWSRVPVDETVFGSAVIESVVEAEGLGLVLVGHDAPSAVVWTSPDGITWVRVPHDETVFGASDMRSVTAGGPGLVTVGTALATGLEWDAAAWYWTP